MTLSYCCSNHFLGWEWLPAGSMSFILNNAKGGTECLLNEWMDEWYSFLSFLDVSPQAISIVNFPWHTPLWMWGWGIFIDTCLCQSLQLTRFPSRIQLCHLCMSQLLWCYSLLISLSISLYSVIILQLQDCTKLIFFFYSENSFLILIALCAFWTTHLNCSLVSPWISEP